MKTVTLRLEDKSYNLIKKASNGEKRSLANYIEVATINYLTEQSFVCDDEMEEILQDKNLLANLEKGKDDIKKDRYKIVK